MQLRKGLKGADHVTAYERTECGCRSVMGGAVLGGCLAYSYFICYRKRSLL